MASQTLLGRDIFSTIWGMVILSSIDIGAELSFPLDQQVLDDVSKHRPALQRLMSAIRVFTALEGEVMSIGTEEAPWQRMNDGKKSFLDEIGIEAELCLNAGKPTGEYNVRSRASIRSGVADGIKNQLGILVWGLISARYCIRPSMKESNLLKEILPVFESLQEILGASSPSADGISLLTYSVSRFVEMRSSAGNKFSSDDAEFNTWTDGVITKIASGETPGLH